MTEPGASGRPGKAAFFSTRARTFLPVGIAASLAAHGAAVQWVARQDPVRPRSDLIFLLAETMFLTVALVCAAALWEFTIDPNRERAPEYRLRLPVWLPFAAYVLLVALTMAVTRQFPSGDESAYQFQARIFGSGRLAAEALPGTERDRMGDFFFMHHVTVNERWFSLFFSGWPALLTLARLARIDAFLNPLLGLLYLLILYRLARAMFGDVAAWCAAGIYAASPSVLFLSAGYMSEPAAAICVLLAFGCWWGSRRSDDLRYPAGFVASMGLLALIRPYSAVCAFAVLGPAAIRAMARSKRRLGVLVLLGGLVGAAVLGWHGYYQAEQMGSPFRTGYAQRYDQLYRLSPSALLHNARTLLPRSTLQAAFYSAALVVPLAVLGLCAERRRRDVLLVLVALGAVFVIGHLPVSQNSGIYYGERYYSGVFFAAALLAGTGLARVLEVAAGRRSFVMLLAIVLMTAQGVHLSLFYWRAYHRFAIPARIRAAVLAERAADAVVFYPAVLHYDLSGRRVNGRDLNDNAVDWRHAARFYMVDPGSERRNRITELLGRKRWVLYGYDVTRDNVTIVQGCAGDPCGQD